MMMCVCGQSFLLFSSPVWETAGFLEEAGRHPSPHHTMCVPKPSGSLVMMISFPVSITFWPSLVCWFPTSYVSPLFSLFTALPAIPIALSISWKVFLQIHSIVVNACSEGSSLFLHIQSTPDLGWHESGLGEGIPPFPGSSNPIRPRHHVMLARQGPDVIMLTPTSIFAC